MGGRDPSGRFRPGQSGNAAGRPKGPGMTYHVRLLWARALEDPQIRQMVIQKLRGAVTSQKTVVAALESAARINREIGLGSDAPVGGVTIIINTNIEPGRLKGGRHTNVDPAKLRGKRLDGSGGAGAT